MALISKKYPMNVSDAWLEQVNIAEHGTIEQKIALASSDEVLDSIQLILIRDDDLQVKIAMSKNPKLTELSKKLLSQQSIAGDVREINDEEMLRAICALEDCEGKEIIKGNGLHRAKIKNSNIPTGIILDMFDCGDRDILWTLLGVSNVRYYQQRGGHFDVERHQGSYNHIYDNASKAMQLKMIDVTMTLEEFSLKNKGVRNVWHLADYVAYQFAQRDFKNMDEETQIYMAEKLVFLFWEMDSDLKLRYKRVEEGDVLYRDIIPLTVEMLQDNPEFNPTAKVILGQINFK